MNLKELKELISLMDEHHLDEMEIEKEGLKVRLKKTGASSPVMVEQLGAHPPAAAAGAPGEVPETPSRAIEIKSPMVGTFYRAPAPDAASFVEVGQEIEPGQVLCIMEAMKLMNEIKSEIRGKIVQIRVENGQPVEFGQVLFVVEPA